VVSGKVACSHGKQGKCGPALTAHGSLDLKHEIQIQIQIQTGEIALAGAE
jgi:hypothetical protein